MLDLCKELRDDSELVKNNVVTCWILDMENYVESNSTCSGGKKMPLESETDFNECLTYFLRTDQGLDYQKSLSLFYDYNNNRIKFMRISA